MQVLMLCKSRGLVSWGVVNGKHVSRGVSLLRCRTVSVKITDSLSPEAPEQTDATMTIDMFANGNTPSGKPPIPRTTIHASGSQALDALTLVSSSFWLYADVMATCLDVYINLCQSDAVAQGFCGHPTQQNGGVLLKGLWHFTFEALIELTECFLCLFDTAL